MIKKKYLYQTVNSMEAVDPRVLCFILVALYDRFIVLNEREINLDGSAYEKAIDQKDSIESLINAFEKLKTYSDSHDEEKVVSQLEICKKKVFWHQMIYGGLKRLKI